MLKRKYKVIAPPKSFNTPLGISKFINQSDLNVDFIILEYGARHKNDIKKLCNLFGADYGILTQISPQHLQTFRTIENIVKTKNELCVFLKEKPCVYNLDCEKIRPLFDEKIGGKFSVSTLNKSSDIFATDIKIEDFEMRFVLHCKDFEFNCKTRLLGKNNIIDILLAAALAINLGISKEDLSKAISTLTPTPHRLEYIKGQINILDDSYNCSLTSAEQSLDVLKHTSGKKMVVTPGIIEGGKFQEKINQKLGKMLSEFDFIVIVGHTNKDAITKGILDANPTKKILFAHDLNHAKQYFGLLSSADTLLLLNDLPDDYN